MRNGYVYMMSNKSGSVIYTGVTTNLPARIAAHRKGIGSRFVFRYRATKVVYIEECASPYEAIVREKQIKGWPRRRKLAQVKSLNPRSVDLMPPSAEIATVATLPRNDEAESS